MRWSIVLLAALAAPRQAPADPSPPGDATAIHSLAAQSDVFPYTRGGKLAIDGGLVVGFPAALPTGLSRGLGAGFSHGGALAWGARAAWVTATESTRTWMVSHADLRLRATGELRHVAGRGAIGLRLAAGGTLVHESRLRGQGERAGLTGGDLATSTYAMLPAADLDAVVAVHVISRYALVVSGGPSVALLDGAAHASWSAQLGVAWRP